MDARAKWRDYSLTGPEADNSVGDWYSTPIPRKRLRALMRRSNMPALMNYGLWLALLAASGIVAYWSWRTWWAIPAILVYGLLYGTGSPSRWHECTHFTVFRTRWLNEVAYHLASFMALKNPYLWRWSHTRHHTYTVVVGRDPEIEYKRPPDILGGLVLNLLHLKSGTSELRKTVLLSFGYLTQDQKDLVPESARSPVIWSARAHLAILLSVIAWSIAIQSILPLMFIGLPTFYGGGLGHLMSATQHAGLAEDVPDHRLNSRTVYMNPVFRFLYSNMNYHVEHHMYPTVPFYSLPELHAEMKGDCPEPYPSMWAAYREIIPALLNQRKNPHHHVSRALPPTANPSPPLSQRPTDSAAQLPAQGDLATAY